MKHRNKVDRITDVNGKKYKLVALKDRTAKNLHHVIWRCNRKEYNTDEKQNKITVPEISHDNLNRFFWNLQTPHEQLKFMLEQRWWKKVLSKWVVAELYWLLALPREVFYKEQLIKPKQKWKSLFGDEHIYKDTI